MNQQHESPCLTSAGHRSLQQTHSQFILLEEQKGCQPSPDLQSCHTVSPSQKRAFLHFRPRALFGSGCWLLACRRFQFAYFPPARTPKVLHSCAHETTILCGIAPFGSGKACYSQQPSMIPRSNGTQRCPPASGAAQYQSAGNGRGPACR